MNTKLVYCRFLFIPSLRFHASWALNYSRIHPHIIIQFLKITFHFSVIEILVLLLSFFSQDIEKAEFMKLHLVNSHGEALTPEREAEFFDTFDKNRDNILNLEGIFFNVLYIFFSSTFDTKCILISEHILLQILLLLSRQLLHRLPVHRKQLMNKRKHYSMISVICIIVHIILWFNLNNKDCS